MPVTFVSLPHRLTLNIQIIGFSLISTGEFSILLEFSLAIGTFHSLLQSFIFLFYMLLSLWKKWHHGYDRDSAKSVGCFGKNGDFNNLIQAVHEHGVCLISLFLNGLFQILKFPMWRFFTTCAKFILSITFFLMSLGESFYKFHFHIFYFLIILGILSGIKIMVDNDISLKLVHCK